MRTKDVFEHFGSQARVARVLGQGRATVNQWIRGEYIPEVSAWRLHHITKGRLKIDPALYDRLNGRKPVPYRDVRKQGPRARRAS